LVKDSLLLDLGNEKVHLYNLGQAHTLHDLVVYLSNHNVLFTGDLIFNRVNPVLKEESGAKVSQWIHALDVILSRWGDSKIIPGHARWAIKKWSYQCVNILLIWTTAALDSEQRKSVGGCI